MLKKLMSMLGIGSKKLDAVPADTKMEVADTGPAKCGCGRSPTGYCVGLHSLSEEDWKAMNNPAPATNDKPAKKTRKKKETTDAGVVTEKKPRATRKPRNPKAS